MTVVHRFTKWVEAFPLSNMLMKTIAVVLVNEVFSRFGIPLELNTDQGKNFDSWLIRELSLLLGIHKTRTTPLHPESDGQVERQHRTILDYLTKFISENQKDWDRWISLFLLAYRSSKHVSTGYTPAEMVTGFDLRLPLDLVRGCPPEQEVQGCNSYVRMLREKLDEIHEKTRLTLRIRSDKAKATYNHLAKDKSFEENKKVWLYNPKRVKGKTPKLQADWEGPYTVVKKINDVVYCISKSPRHKKKIVNISRLATYTDRMNLDIALLKVFRPWFSLEYWTNVRAGIE